MFLLFAARTEAQPKGSDVNPCVEFDALNSKIRDGALSKKDASLQLNTLLAKVKKYYESNKSPTVQSNDEVFPLAGYDYHAAGGSSGSGYIAGGYDYFDGNKHGGHPAHDLFIHDKNQDCLDDNTAQKVKVLSVSYGIVVATETQWQPGSTQRGGNYVWIYNPEAEKLYYYAHNSVVLVKPGDMVKPGDTIALVGRSGANAAKKRSPTHLHFMVLTLGKDIHPRPENSYEELKNCKKARAN